MRETGSHLARPCIGVLSTRPVKLLINSLCQASDMSKEGMSYMIPALSIKLLSMTSYGRDQIFMSNVAHICRLVRKINAVIVLSN